AQTRVVQVSYEITYLGLTGFRIDFSGQFTGNSYDVQSHTFKQGLIKAVTIQYEGRNRAWGSFLPNAALASGGSLALAVGGNARTWAAQYGPGGMVSDQHNPVWKPAPQQTIPADQQLKSLDPLSAAMSVGVAGDAACDRTVPSNDGKRRIDVIMK